MVTGEHAVVYGQPAIVCAVEQRIQITATTLESRVAEVHSTIAAPVSTSLDAIVVDGPMKFVLAVIAHYSDYLQQGVRLNIASEINPTMGLGSSAAVTAASLAAIHYLVHGSEQPDLRELHQTGLKITRDIQGRGSGADLAASLNGGMLAYQLPTPAETQGACATPATVQSLPLPPDFSLRYCGYKTPTAEVLAKVAAAREGNEKHYDDLYIQMGACAKATISAARNKNWPSFANHLQAYQNLMQALGVSDDTLQQLIAEARRNPDTMAVKISGSGLGDCVVAVGPVPDGFTPLTVASKGLHFET